MTLLSKRQVFLASLPRHTSAQARLSWLVEHARQQTPLEAEFKTEAHRVPGCLSKLWLIAQCREGRCFFRCDSDSQIIKAIAGLLCDFYSNCLPAEILSQDPSFFREAGITQHLTGNRRNALSRVWETIRAFAVNQSIPAEMPK